MLEANRLRTLWPQLYGAVAVQLGHVGGRDLMDACLAPKRYVVDLPPFETPSLTSAVYAEVDALPFDTRSVDLALLPHTLEFAADPHQVLREVQRVLTPQGYVVLFGFNPVSLWGLWRVGLKHRGRMPWCGHFIQLLRVKDWLKLLGFELVHGKMLYYRPPLSNEALMDRLYFLDKIGDRWWPMAGAVYFVVAQKRVLAMTPLRPKWRARPVVGDALAQPAGRVMDQ
jgi:SAM-dependent methyltransferase